MLDSHQQMLLRQQFRYYTTQWREVWIPIRNNTAPLLHQSVPALSRSTSFVLYSALSQMLYDEEQRFSMMAYRKSLGSTTQTLKDFHYNLAAALINSANYVYFQNVLIAEPNRARVRCAEEQNLNAALSFDRQPDTLAEWLLQEQWPKRHRYRSFMNRKNLLELRFTHNDEFNHELSKDKKVESCTALFV